jgi:hypothetical protein
MITSPTIAAVITATRLVSRDHQDRRGGGGGSADCGTWVVGGSVLLMAALLGSCVLSPPTLHRVPERDLKPADSFSRSSGRVGSGGAE